MVYKIEHHPVTLRFLGAVDGRVVPSGTILSVKNNTRQKTTDILVDSGSAMREETPEGKNMDSLQIPSNIDAVVISHSHTDHCGALPEVVSKNPTAPVFAPEGNKHVINIIAHEALKRSQGRDIMREIREWREDNRKIVKRIIAIEETFKKGVKRGRKGRTQTTNTTEEKDAHIKSLETELETLEGVLFNALGVSQYSVPAFLELVGKKVKHPGNYDVTEADLLFAIDIVWKGKLQNCAEQGFMTAEDVDKATNKIQEVQFNTRHKVASLAKDKQSGGDIMMTMRESGHTHTVPSAQVFFEVPVRKGKKIGVLFSGDRGSSQLLPPYSQANDKGLENKADVLVLEATYGNRVHKNREEALQKLDKIVLGAIERGEDIIFPTISLDRPLMVMYEIVTRLLNKNPKIAEKVDIYHFGVMMERILSVAAARKHPMEKEIRKFWKHFSDNQKKMLGKKGKKSRFIFAGGGFLPKNGSPAGAILEFALEQPDLNILIPNYHGGPGSNADNLIQGREFLLTKENPCPRKLEGEQKGVYIEGFSGHEDGPGLVSYARKVMKDGGTIYLNHGSEDARQALYLLLINDPIIKQKRITVVLPTVNQEYAISTSGHAKSTPQAEYYKEKKRKFPEQIGHHMLRRLHSKMILMKNQKRFSSKKRID